MISDKELMKIKEEHPEEFQKRFDETAENCRLSHVPEDDVLYYLKSQYVSKRFIPSFQGFMEGLVDAMNRPNCLILAASGLGYMKLISNVINDDLGRSNIGYMSITTGTIVGMAGLHYISNMASKRKIRPLEAFFDWFYSENHLLPSYSEIKKDADRNRKMAGL